VNYNNAMTETQNDKKKPGPPSIEDVYGETFTDYRFKLPDSQLNHLRQASASDHVSIAEYLRRLIAADMSRRPPGHPRRGARRLAAGCVILLAICQQTIK
jgi:hypothetical protein